MASPDLRFLDVQRERWSPARFAILALALLAWGILAAWLVTGMKGHFMVVAFRVPMWALIGTYATLDVLFRRIEIRVQGDALELRRFVPLANRSRSIPLETIESTKVASVYPRIDRTPWATNRTDHEGVHLRLQGGEYVFISTPRAEDLAAALRTPAALSPEGAIV